MLQLELALVQDELDHDARDKSQSDCCHEHKVVGSCSFLDIYILLVDWEGLVDDIVSKFRVVCSHSKDSLVHVLREHGCGVLRSHIQKVANAE